MILQVVFERSLAQLHFFLIWRPLVAMVTTTGTKEEVGMVYGGGSRCGWMGQQNKEP